MVPNQAIQTTKKNKPKHLGRGLQSLLGPINMPDTSSNARPELTLDDPNFPIDKSLQESIRKLAIELVQPNPYQPRIACDRDQLADLAESIKVNGVLQPIIVRKAGASYQLIAGERRLKAAQMAGLKTISAIVRQATDQQLLELALIENIHRADLNPIERAQAYSNYLQTYSLTQAQAAERLSENRSVLANYLRLLDLPPEMKQMLIEQKLSMGHARAILALPTDELKRKLANRALAGRLSVRDVERLVRKYITGTTQPARTARTKPPHIAELETRLSRQLGTRVSIATRKNGQRGRITIEFYSVDEFDRIVERMGLACAEEL